MAKAPKQSAAITAKGPVRLALQAYRERKQQAEAELRADPWFRAATAQGKRLDAAENAAHQLCKPLLKAIKRLVGRHPRGYPQRSATAEKLKALDDKIIETRRKAYADHGFREAVPARTPAELAEELQLCDYDDMADLIESVSGKRPGADDLLRDQVKGWWGLAKAMRDAKPRPPRLPVRGGTVRKRYYQLCAWCDLAVTAGAARPLTEREQEAVAALRKARCRMSGPELSKRAWGVNGSRKQLLAQMVALGVLTNAEDQFGKGYGLQEWTRA